MEYNIELETSIAQPRVTLVVEMSGYSKHVYFFIYIFRLTRISRSCDVSIQAGKFWLLA